MGQVETMMTSQEVTEVILKYRSDEQLKENNYILENIINKADVLLSVGGIRNTKSIANIDPSRLMLVVQTSAPWIKVFSEKIGCGKIRWCGSQIPTYAEAQEASMSLSEYEDFVYAAGLLDKDDSITE